MTLLPTSPLKPRKAPRSEAHTSELQSPCNLVCRLPLETKTHGRPSCRDFKDHADLIPGEKPLDGVDPARRNDGRAAPRGGGDAALIYCPEHSPFDSSVA